MIFNPCNVVIKWRSQTVCAVITPKTLQDDDEWLIPILSITEHYLQGRHVSDMPANIFCIMLYAYRNHNWNYKVRSLVFIISLVLIRNICLVFFF